LFIYLHKEYNNRHICQQQTNKLINDRIECPIVLGYVINMSTDLTFITNESGQTLRNRFEDLLHGHTRFFDCLVAYFYVSGFFRIYRSLERTEKVRILIGRGTISRAGIL